MADGVILRMAHTSMDKYYPAIMDFLGYCPYQRAATIGG